MSKVILKGYLTVSTQHLDGVKEHLNTHVQLTRNETGCIVFNVTQSEDDPSIFNVYEEFEDSVAFFAHQERVKNSLWGEVAKNVKREYEITGL